MTDKTSCRGCAHFEEKPCFIEANREEAAVWLTPVNYGRGWRCWTARPTDEQSEAAPWQD